MYENMTKDELIQMIQKSKVDRKSRHFQEWRRKIRNYKEMNLLAKKGQILFVGSSLMEFFPVAEYCMSAGVEEIVYNRGISGSNTDEFLEEIDTVLFDLEPSKVFINIGTNDINKRDDGEYWQNHLLKNYEEILQQMKKRLPETIVYIMAYYPVNEAMLYAGREIGPRSNAALNDTNAKLQILAEKYNYHYIDVNDGIKDENGNLRAEITMEGMHLSSGGYKSVFEALKKYL